MSAVQLRRVAAGYYRTRDGAHEIVQGPAGCPWAGQWVVRSSADPSSYTDPMGTLRECRAHLAAKTKYESDVAACYEHPDVDLGED